MRLRTLARHAVGLARIDHHAERTFASCRPGEEHGRVFEHDIVVGHAVDDEERIPDAGCIRQRAGLFIDLPQLRRIAQIALGIACRRDPTSSPGRRQCPPRTRPRRLQHFSVI